MSNNILNDETEIERINILNNIVVNALIERSKIKKLKYVNGNYIKDTATRLFNSVGISEETKELIIKHKLMD